MLVGLVAVRILADETGNIGRCIGGQCRGRGEQRVEFRLERRVAAEMRDLAVDIVLVQERRLPAIRLGIIAVVDARPTEPDRVVRDRPRPRCQARTRKADRGVQHVAIVQAAVAQRRGIVGRARRGGEVRHRPVVIGIFLRPAD